MTDPTNDRNETSDVSQHEVNNEYFDLTPVGQPTFHNETVDRTLSNGTPAEVTEETNITSFSKLIEKYPIKNERHVSSEKGDIRSRN